MSHDVEECFARYVERHVATGERPDLALLCPDEDLRRPLATLVARYHDLAQALEPETEEPLRPLPSLEGFRTLERLGRGGGGEVFKLEDQTLGRVVAAKVLRQDSPLLATVGDFLREARALALFDDPRIVRLLEYRAGDPPVLLMEYVDGFALDEVGPSLSFAQRARIIAEVARALARAHDLGLQHRDLKPGHILVDAQLRPKILDFGLSRGEPDRGHGVGTFPYMAPEQLDAQRAIDARSDVYALGVILYQLLCGRLPGADAAPLPTEVDPQVPEPLQAVALTAMSSRPEERYATAREMAEDLERWLEGRPVHARPSAYRRALAQHVSAHLEQIGEWRRARLVYPHEAERLVAAYHPLERREDDWIVASRVLSNAQIASYLGAFLLAGASVLYLTAYLGDALAGLLHPALSLVLPFAALSGAAHLLYGRGQRATAVAFALGAAALLPLAATIALREAGLWLAPAGDPHQLLEKISNRQLQVALAATCLWLVGLAARTRTVGLSTGAVVCLLAFHLASTADLGLRRWLEQGRYDRVAFALAPLAALTLAAGWATERRRLPWFAEPLYYQGLAAAVVTMELLALDGRALRHLGLTLASTGGTAASDPTLLDTVAVMVANGVLVYLTGVVLERRGSSLLRTPGRLLYALSPFLTLEPLAYLVGTAEYSKRFDWLYLLLAVTIAFVAERRQRTAFFFAGLANCGVALYAITAHNEWFDRPNWSLAVLAAGTCALVAGLAFERRDRRRRTGPPR